MTRRSLTIAGLALLAILGWTSAGWLVAHPGPSGSLVAQVGSSVPGPVIRYITPTGAGKKDGSTIANAAMLTGLDSMIAAVGAGGEVHILADRGTYTVTGQISVRHGGTPSAPVVIMGVNAAGQPANVPIAGNRASPYSVSGAAGPEVFRLLAGADNLHFEYFSFANVGNGAFHIGENLSNLTLEHMQATNVRRFLEDYVAGSATDASVSGLTVRDVTVNGYSKAAMRIQYDSSNILIEDVTGDSQRQDGDNFTEGIALDGTAHDAVFRRVTMMNSTDTIHTYWNGDGFSSERGNYNLRFENTTANGNTDAGYDLKSNHVLMLNTLAFDNKDNYKLWGTDDVVLQGITARDPHKRGGTGAQAQFEIVGDGTNVTLKDSTVTDTSASTVVYHLNGNNQLVTVNNVSVTKNAAARLSASDADNGTGSKLVDTTSVPSAPAPTVSLSAASSTFALGGGTILTWSSANATSCTASGGWTGALALSGTRSITPAATAAYTIACIGAGGTTTQSVTVTVTPKAPVPVVSLSAAASPLTAGASATLTWSSSNATSCTASGGWTGSLGTSGTRTLAPSVTTAYTIACAGAGGTVTRSVTITVQAPAAPTLSLTAASTTMTAGSATTLSWSSATASACTASGGWTGAKAVTGTERVTVATTTRYVLTCAGAGGSVAKDVTITARPASPPPSGTPSVSLSAGTTTLLVGASTSLTWSSANAASCAASGGWTGALALSGTRSVTPATTTSYTIACAGAGGTTTKSISIAVHAPPPASVPAPTLTFSAPANTLALGASVPLTWSTANAAFCTASGGWTGSFGTSGTRAITPATTTTYALTCTGAGGSITRSLALTVLPSIASGDVNGDGIVNSLDYSLLNKVWGKNDRTKDVNNDGVVNAKDLAILVQRWFVRIAH